MYVTKLKNSHSQVAGVKCHRLSTQETKMLVADSDTYDNLSFYANQGYVSNEYKWVDERTVLIASSEKSNTVLNKINVETGERKKWKMVFELETEFVKILAFDEFGGLLFRTVNFYRPSSLGYVKCVADCFREDGNSPEIIFEQARNAISHSAVLAPGCLFQEVFSHPESPDVVAYFWGLREFEGKTLRERPAFVFAHGGPHSVRHAIYDPAFNVLLNRGFLILMVNFSGTFSYGDEFNERINGRISEIEINEIYRVISLL